MKMRHAIYRVRMSSINKSESDRKHDQNNSINHVRTFWFWSIGAYLWRNRKQII